MTVLFAVLVIQFFASSSDKEKSNEIKTESDKAGSGCESWNLLNVRHHLGNAVKNPQPSQYQRNCPDYLGLIHLFVSH